MTRTHAQELLAAFSGKRILVVGDVMLDEYIWGQANRISPEAPVMVVDADRYTHVPGGAANVVNNLCALGATGIMVGVVGDDSAGALLVDALQAEGADTTGLITVTDRPTTRKTRIIAHSQQVVRVDHEKRTALDALDIERLSQVLAELIPKADAVLLSDYQKGVLAPDLIRRCVELTPGNKPITGNLKPKALSEHSSLTILTLNIHEARMASGGEPLDTPEAFEIAGQEILNRTGSEHVLITRGSDGLSLFSRRSGDSVHIPARLVAVYDVAGAGDTVISAMTLALAAGASPVEAVTLANYAAAEAVKKVGVATVTRDEILAAFQE